MKFCRKNSSYIFYGLLIGLSLLYSGWWPVGLVGIGLFLLRLEKADWKERYIGSFTTWTTKSLCATAFFWSIYPIEWLPLEINEFSIVIIGLCWLGVSLFLGLGGVFFVGLLHFMQYLGVRFTERALLTAPLAWLVAEIIGAYAFSMFSIGPGGTINSYFSFSYVGYLLTEHSLLLQTAVVAGVYGLIILTLILVILFTRLYTSKRWWSLGGLVFVLLITASVSVPDRHSTDTVSVAVIETKYPVQDLFSREGAVGLKTMQQQAFTAAVGQESDYILWPEDARFIDQSDGIEQGIALFNFQYPAAETIVVDSSRVPYEDSAILQTLIYDMGTGEYAYAHKRYLVPQGEFIPYLYELIMRVLGLGPLVNELESLVSYYIGPKISQADFDEIYPSVLFCFEGISPTGVKQLLRERSTTPFIAHPISHSWFHEPKEVWHQLDASLKVQAVWNDVAIVSPANHAESKVYLPNGSMRELEPTVVGKHFEVAVVTIPVR